MSTDGKHWWEYVDPTVTLELLDGTCGGWVAPPPSPPRDRVKTFCGDFRAHARVPADPGEDAQSAEADPQLEGERLFLQTSVAALLLWG